MKRKMESMKNGLQMRRTINRNSQMKAKRRAANKICRDEFEEKAREEKPRFFVDLDDTSNP